MCQAKAEGGKRCSYADQVTNVRKKALYKHRGSYNRHREAEKAVNDWKDANRELVAEHLPDSLPFQVKPRDIPVPRTLLEQFTPSPRVPILGGDENLTKKCYEEYQKWTTKLTEDEEGTLRNYSMNGYQEINSILRRNTLTLRRGERHMMDEEHWARVTERTRTRHIPNLDSAFSKVPENQQVRKLYRFYRIPAGMTTGQFIDKYIQEGEGFQDAGYMSTTSDPGFLMAHIADRLAGKPNNHYVVFEILTAQGGSLQDYEVTRPGNVQTMEHEYLIPRRTKFRIVGARKRQKFKYGRDRKDLFAQYERGMFSEWAWDREKKYRADDGMSLPVIQLIDEKLIRQHTTEE